jgi:hypothetical protein
MNVYFCDVCGVRVTDVDLHSGHGIRRRHDVICAACLDLGHGKEWINGTGAGTANGGASAVAAAPSRPAVKSAPAPVVPAIARARDDLATIDEEPPERTPSPPALAPAPIFDDEDAESLPAPVAEAPPQEDSGGIAALTGVDEVLDGVPMAPQGETEASSPFDHADAASAADVASGRAPAERPAKKDSSRQPQAKTGRSSPNGKSARSSTKSGKYTKKQGMSPIMLLGIVAVVCVLVCLVVALKSGMIPGMESEKSATVVTPENLGSPLDNAISDARAAYKKAMASKSLPDVDAALAKIDDLRTVEADIEATTKQMHPPWTEDDLGRFYDQHGVSDVKYLRKALSDLRVTLLPH